MKIIIIGLGNPILGDDGVGVRVVNMLKEQIDIDDSIEIRVEDVGGLELAEMILGYDAAIIVDAAITQRYPVGTVFVKNINEYPYTVHTVNPHDINFITGISLFRRLFPEKIPDKIIVIGIEINANSLKFSNVLSPEIKNAAEKAVEIILKLLNLIRRGVQCDCKISN